MCGRYYVDDEMVSKIERVLGQIEMERKRMQAYQGRRDVRPSETADILVGSDRWSMRQMEWGVPMEAFFPMGQRSPAERAKGRVINVRAETALRKPAFREAMRNSRCVIPAMGFYEWNQEKEKAEFYREDRQALFMAGFYERSGERARFVILTTKANASVAPVHDRMPLILEGNEAVRFMRMEQSVEELLKKEPLCLKRSQAYEQQRLPF